MTALLAHTPGEQDEFDEVLYGGFHLDDPRDFFPDGECCTPEELEAHREACDKAGRGEDWLPRSEEHGPWRHSDGRTVLGDRPPGDGWVGGCVTNYSFGIGTYLIHQGPPNPSWVDEDPMYPRGDS